MIVHAAYNNNNNEIQTNPSIVGGQKVSEIDFNLIPNKMVYLIWWFKASEGQFPHVVSLRASFGHFCGGAILNRRFILSAAHCWWFLDIIAVVAGATALNATDGIRYEVVEKINFPGYNFSADPFRDE